MYKLALADNTVFLHKAKNTSKISANLFAYCGGAFPLPFQACTDTEKCLLGLSLEKQHLDSTYQKPCETPVTAAD